MTQTAEFCARVRGGEVVFGAWTVISDPVAAGAVARTGLDYVVVDLQHGAATEAGLPALTSAIRLAGAAPLARVRHASQADIGRALDLGCAGVIVPNVDSAQEARAAVGACRYPPDGYRSAGGVLAAGEPLCLVMVESAAALADLPATLAIPGLDGIYVGPRDLSLSLGCSADPRDPVQRAALEQVWALCAGAGLPAGVHAAGGGHARLYREQGCRLITVAADATVLAGAVTAELATARD